MIRTLPLLMLMLVLSKTANAAKEFPAQLRLFAGALAADPKDVNEELEANSLKKFDTITMFGGEISRPLAKHFEMGLRYSVRIGSQDELVSSELTDYRANLNQEVYSLIARVPIVKSSIVRFDAWGAYGGSNTSLKIKTATYEGAVEKKSDSSWVAAPHSMFGASLAIGFSRVYIVIEGGMENNKIKSLKRTGTINSNIEEIDLSGGFVNIGLLIDGMATKK